MTSLINKTEIKYQDVELIIKNNTGEFEKKLYLSLEHFEQIMLNLLYNALNATRKLRDRQPRVVIEFTSIDNGNGIQVSVSDNGVGIKKQDREKIFDTGFSLGQGSGIGLSLVKAKVEESGSEIKVNSIEGAGTEFVFNLPLIS